jgi:beta-glucanase (GH16 family)
VRRCALPRNIELAELFVFGRWSYSNLSDAFSRERQQPTWEVNLRTFVLTLLLSALPAMAQTPPAQAAGYTLAFSNTFTPFSLSPNSEGNYIWYNPGQPSGVTAPAANISVSKSILTLDWTKGQKAFYTNISTAASNGSYYRAWRYGYFEVSMAWDPVTGSWPAIWMRPIQYTLNNKVESGELDIFEGQGATPNMFYGSIHDWAPNNTGVDLQNNEGNNWFVLPSTTNVTQYHTYGLLWVPGQVTWYFDNTPVLTAATYPIFDEQNYYLILGSQEGVNWTYGNLTGVKTTTIPMKVQWVHVFQAP